MRATTISPEILPLLMRIPCDLYHEMIAKGVLNPAHKVELLNGFLCNKESVGTTHAGVVKALSYFLSHELNGAAIIALQNPITINEYSEPEPDLVVARFREDFYRNGHPTPEDIHLVVEVADSSLALDRQAKIPLYAACGLPEVWLVNLVEKKVTVYQQPDGSAYGRVTDVLPGQTLPVPGFPEASIAVDSLGL
jgi:Uma2 family endonuclease